MKKIINKNNGYLLLYSILNLILIFRIDFLALPNYLIAIAIVALGLAFLKYRKKNIKETLILLGILFALVIFAILSILINNGETSYLMKLFAVVYKFGLAIISIKAFKCIFGKKATFEKFCKTFAISCLLLVFSSIILIFFSRLNHFWVGSVVPRNSLLDEGYFTRISVLGYTGFDEVATYSISYFCCAYVISLQLDKGNKNIFLWGIAYLILIFGGLLYGRVSVIAIFLSCIALIVMCKNKKIAILALLVVIALAIIVFDILYLLSLRYELIQYWFGWAFEIVKVIFGQKGSISSVDAMFKMYVYPNSFKTWIIGDGRLVDGSLYYMGTDIGFLRSIYFFGLPGLLLTYYFVIKTTKLTIENYCNTRVSTMLIFILGVMFIFEFKGLSWDNYLHFLFCVLLLSKEYKRKKDLFV